MRQLGEQWIVKQDDGRNHLIEKVDAKEGHYKDLGPVNDMGMLRIPFEVPEGYPLYPTIKSYSTSIEAKDSLFQVVYSNVRLHMAYGFFNSEQEAIDAWNRRN